MQILSFPANGLCICALPPDDRFSSSLGLHSSVGFFVPEPHFLGLGIGTPVNDPKDPSTEG